MLKAVNDVPVPKTRTKICVLALSEMWVQKKIKETGVARRTDFLNDQTLDKVAWTHSESDFSSTESALWEWHARKEHNFPVSKKLAVKQRFACPANFKE